MISIPLSSVSNAILSFFFESESLAKVFTHLHITYFGSSNGDTAVLRTYRHKLSCEGKLFNGHHWKHFTTRAKIQHTLPALFASTFHKPSNKTIT